MAADAKRMIAELRELAQLTGDERGAQRLAWTDVWARAREWERGLLAELPVEVDVDEAGNQWATLPGRSPKALIIGSHIDSVPERRLARRLPRRAVGARGAALAVRRRAAAADGQARGLGRRGGGPLRPQPARLDGRGRTARPRFRPPSARRERHLRGRRAGRPRRRRGPDGRVALAPDRTPPPTSSCTSSRARCWRRATCRSGWSRASTGPNGGRSRSPARPPTPAPRRWTSGATRCRPPHGWR